VQTESGPVPALMPPAQTEARFDPVPRLGEHSDSILGELGYDADGIARLRAAGAV
jgi:crotonobetainyl-CoA:carnitine CoA-transferase CaiB-like acyl-CoA transferase